MENGFLTLFAAWKVKTGRCSVLHLPGKLALSQRYAYRVKHPVVIDKTDLSMAMDCLETGALQTQYVKRVQAKLLLAVTEIKTSELYNYC